MRRNWDTIRAVLLAIEAGGGRYEIRPDDGDVFAHACMLSSGGYLAAEGHRAILTHTGRDLLDAIRDDRVWGLCQQVITLNGGGLPTDLLIDVARGAIRARASLIVKSDGPIPWPIEPGTVVYT